MRLKVNPNRMEYLKLRKRAELAVHGHKLLKEKQDGLIQEFFKVVRKSKQLRRDVEEKLKKVYQAFVAASSIMTKKAMGEALMSPLQKIEPEVTIVNRMGVKVPVFHFDIREKIHGYGFFGTSGELDNALSRLLEVYPQMLELSRLEKQVQLISDDLEATRRRVNALEHLFIPNLQETIKYISMKLSEDERSAATRLMRVKEIVRK